MAIPFRMTPARRAALRKAQLASARKRKAGFHKANRKKLSGRRAKLKGIQEYVSAGGVRTGKATNTANSRTFGSAMRKGARAGRHNKKYEKKLRKHNKRINKAVKRLHQQPLKHRAISKLQGKNPHSRRATFVAEKTTRRRKRR